MKILSNIFEVGGPSLSHPSDAAVYLIASGSEAALVDAGTGRATERILMNAKRCGIGPDALKYLFLTHCHFDHTGGAEEIRQHTACKIVCHNLDAVYLESGDSEVTAASWYGSFMRPLPIDIKVSEPRRTFSLGDLDIEFIHTPGHSPGSSVLTVRSDGMLVLFGQDVHGPLNDTLLSDRSQYRQSLEFLMSLNADVLCEGHFGVYQGKEEVRDFIESFL
ncbi:MAG TPA: MBL fold metallo-hydrolase [Spirochaetota bacterium]|nr:MBL fold metallo-hydrolase [Spirochaetota bacterium]HPI91246.1 MBL fold metallo-hydrolase [Spirochaetota bacterium]HPR49958.1 MBL fold metallo-hydrolase [Spirochaetota bacterium]